MQRTALIFAFALGACSNAPYCSEYVDLTGRAAVYCPSALEQPVCDHPGESAHFADGPDGAELRDGEYATCDADFQVTCPLGSEGPVRCIPTPGGP